MFLGFYTISTILSILTMFSFKGILNHRIKKHGYKVVNNESFDIGKILRVLALLFMPVINIALATLIFLTWDNAIDSSFEKLLQDGKLQSIHKPSYMEERIKEIEKLQANQMKSASGNYEFKNNTVDSENKSIHEQINDLKMGKEILLGQAEHQDIVEDLNSNVKTKTHDKANFTN